MKIKPFEMEIGTYKHFSDMYKEREPILEKLSIVFQVSLTLLCFWIAIRITNNFFEPITWNSSHYKILSFFIVLLWLVLLDLFNLGGIGRIKMDSVSFIEYLTVIIVGNILLFASIVIFDLTSISRFAIWVFIIINFIVLYSFKFVLSSVMGFIRREGMNSRLILLIADKDSVSFIDRLAETKDWGYRIWAIMSDDPDIKEKYSCEYLIIPYEHDLSQIIDKRAIDEVFYCKNSLNQDEIQRFIYSCAEVGVVFRMQSLLLNYVNIQSSLSFLNQMPFLTFRNTPDNYLALRFKAIFDFSISLLILTILFPISAAIAILVKLDGGPAFVLQKRTGLNGKHFFCYKFRTMNVNEESLETSLITSNGPDEQTLKVKNDPRLTKIGRVLRKTSLEKIPQFINVIKGEMAIVGPRPARLSEVKRYERWQNRRLTMKPGITGSWQPSDENSSSFDQRLKMDLQYIDTWSLKLDAAILLKTTKALLSGDL